MSGYKPQSSPYRAILVSMARVLTDNAQPKINGELGGGFVQDFENQNLRCLHLSGTALRLSPGTTGRGPGIGRAPA
jgi:hypothetical protein